MDGARLDITHYKAVVGEQLAEIELEANKIIKKGNFENYTLFSL